jgi:hypothetical protein
MNNEPKIYNSWGGHALDPWVTPHTMEVTDEIFQELCRKRTKDTRKCKFCAQRFACWTEVKKETQHLETTSGVTQAQIDELKRQLSEFGWGSNSGVVETDKEGEVK